MKTETCRHVLLCATLFLASFTGSARAAGPKLTLHEAARMALESLPQLEAAKLRVSSATERVSAARGRYAPVTSMRIGATQSIDSIQVADERAPPGTNRLKNEQPSSRSWQAVATLRLDLYDFGARRHALRSARASEELARADLTGAQLGAVLGVVEPYLTVLRDERRVVDAELSVSIQERQVAMITRLVERKARPEVDLQRAQIQLQTARDSVEVLKAETRRDRVQLAFALGVQSIEGVELEPVPEQALAYGEQADDAARTALAERPEPRAARANALAFREGARASGAALAPRISLEGSASFTRIMQADDPLRTGDRGQASAGAFLSWSGLDPTAWATRRAQLRDAQAAEADAHAVQREVRALVLSSIEEQQRATASVERAQHLREGAQATLDAQQRRYELGAASLLELLDAQSLEQQARALLIDAELAEELAMARVLANAGLLAKRTLTP